MHHRDTLLLTMGVFTPRQGRQVGTWLHMGWCTPEGVNDTLVLTLWLFHDRQLEPMTKKLHFADIHRI